VASVSAGQLSKICRGEILKWPDGRPVVLVLHRPPSDEQRTLEKLTKWSETDLKAFVAAHPASIRFVDSDEAVVDQVQSTRGAIGFVEARSITDQVNVVKIDNKLPHEAGYLSH
jgi:ABC-type phosphate transport system substrate-binding protein